MLRDGKRPACSMPPTPGYEEDLLRMTDTGASVTPIKRPTLDMPGNPSPPEDHPADVIDADLRGGAS